MRSWIGAVVIAVSVVAGAQTVEARDIKGAVVSVPDDLSVEQAFDIPLNDYWRGNMKVGPDGLADNKKDFPHVPNLISYKLEVGLGGTYELQARYASDEPHPAYLRIDGELQGSVFQQTGDPDTWVRLARVGLRPGTREIRFTSHYVETHFPVVKGLRLVFRGGPVPPPRPEPEVYRPRPELEDDWYKSIRRKIHGDFHTSGHIRGIGKDFDPDEYGRALVEAGVDSICVFAKGHHGYAYYNTRVGTRHPGLDFDLLQKQIEACQKYGIKIWAYFSIGRDELYSSTLEQVVDDPHTRSTRLDIRIDSDYVQNQIWPMVTEVVRDYDLDGVFFDFTESEEFVQRTHDLIKSIKPGVVVACNHQWLKSRTDLGKLDVLELESWDHKMPNYHWQYFARYARGAVPMTAMTTRFWIAWGDFGGVADEAMLWFHTATALANGCLVSIGDHLHPFGRLEPAVYERIGRVFNYTTQVEEYVIDSESVPYVAMTRPLEVTHGFNANQCAALVDGGIHFTVIDPTQSPDDFKAVVVPDASIVGADQAARLEAYVRNGGRLILMGQLSDALARLAGVELGERQPASYVRGTEHLPSVPAVDLFTYEPVLPARPLQGTEVLAPIVWPLNHGTIYRSIRNSPSSDVPSEWAAITWRQVDRGQVAYSAVPLLDAYANWGYTPLRQILTDLLERMIPPAERVAQVRTPAPLEVSVTRQGERLIVHLVHCPQSRRAASSTRRDDLLFRHPVIDGMPTVSGVQLDLPEALVGGRTMRIVPDDTTVRPSGNAEGLVTYDIPEFTINTILVLE